jgi:hypothetical protein
MTFPKIVSRAEWLIARKALLKKRKGNDPGRARRSMSSAACTDFAHEAAPVFRSRLINC